MSSNIVTGAFGGMGRERLMELTKLGAAMGSTGEVDSELQDVKSDGTEIVVGQLTPEEFEVLRALLDAQTKSIEFTKSIQMRGLRRSLNYYEEGKGALRDLPELVLENTTFANRVEVQHFFQLKSLIELLMYQIHYIVGERLNLFDHVLGFRTRGRIVSLGTRAPNDKEPAKDA